MDDRHARAALTALLPHPDPTLVDEAADRGVAAVAGRLLGEVPGHVGPAQLLEECARHDIRFVVPGDDEWPGDAVAPLEALRAAPWGLWVTGTRPLTDLLAGPVVTVTGARAATAYGTGVAGDLTTGLVAAGVTVCAGSGFGIEQATHRAALAAAGSTVAVLPCGLDRVYPSAHRGLLAAVAARGALVSEAPPGTAPSRARILGRSRLLAAFAQTVVLVESAARGSALETVRWAELLARPVAALPGPVTSGLSQAPHDLIRSGRARLVTTATDVLTDVESPVRQ